MANLRKGATAQVAIESAIQAIAEIASYLDSHVTKGRTTSELKSASKSAVGNLSKTMADLRKAHNKFNSD